MAQRGFYFFLMAEVLAAKRKRECLKYFSVAALREYGYTHIAFLPGWFQFYFLLEMRGVVSIQGDRPDQLSHRKVVM